MASTCPSAPGSCSPPHGASRSPSAAAPRPARSHLGWWRDPSSLAGTGSRPTRPPTTPLEGAAVSPSSLPPTRSAAETAAVAGDAVYRLRDQTHSLATPQVIHTVLVLLADVPGRLANIYDTLAARLDTLAEDDQLTRDDGDGAAAWFD